MPACEGSSRPPAVQEKQDSGDNDNWGRRRDRLIDWEGADAAGAPRAAVPEGGKNAGGTRGITRNTVSKQQAMKDISTGQW